MGKPRQTRRMGYFMSKLILDFNWLLGHLRRIYFMALPENEEDYEKSRGYYIAGDSATQTIAQLAGGTFLVSLMLSVNIPDATIGSSHSMASFALFPTSSQCRKSTASKKELFVSTLRHPKLSFSILHPPHVPGKPHRTIPYHCRLLFCPGLHTNRHPRHPGLDRHPRPHGITRPLFLPQRRRRRIRHRYHHAHCRRHHGQNSRTAPTHRLSHQRQPHPHPGNP